eukprot:PhM_4_TR3065/c1_g1_i1/m.30300/K08857/NEK1_4_5; NIMA (never in mitosis gene a)-related kinase 1/4/5
MDTFPQRSMLGYQLLPIKILGKGACGMAWLVRCVDPRLVNSTYRGNSVLVVKTVDLSHVNAVRYGASEVRIMQSLDHPNIVRCYDAWVEPSTKEHKERRLCIAMEHCAGGDLNDYYRTHNRPTEERLRCFVSQLMSVMCYLHHIKCTVHRDLKLANVFFGDNAATTLKIGDFGIARSVETSLDMRLTMIGTPYYMAPEVVQHNPYNKKADMWSLGVLLFEIMTKRRPFGGRSINDIYDHIRKDPAPSVASIVGPRFSVELTTLCQTLLTKNKNERPSAREVVEAFTWIERDEFIQRTIENATDVVDDNDTKADIQKKELSLWRLTRREFTISVRTEPHMKAPVCGHILHSTVVRQHELSQEGLNVWMRIDNNGWVLFKAANDLLWSEVDEEGDTEQNDTKQINPVRAVRSSSSPPVLSFEHYSPSSASPPPHPSNNPPSRRLPSPIMQRRCGEALGTPPMCDSIRSRSPLAARLRSVSPLSPPLAPIPALVQESSLRPSRQNLHIDAFNDMVKSSIRKEAVEEDARRLRSLCISALGSADRFECCLAVANEYGKVSGEDAIERAETRRLLYRVLLKMCRDGSATVELVLRAANVQEKVDCEKKG